MKMMWAVAALAGWLCVQHAGAADKQNKAGAVAFDQAELEPGKIVKINDKLQLIGGFSQGGWETAHIAEAEPKLFAGMIITGAGRNNYGKAPQVRGLNIFIGVGDKDGNRASAEEAAGFYRKKGAKVALELFKGTGHGVDTKNEALKTWLKDQAAAAGPKSAGPKAGG